MKETRNQTKKLNLFYKTKYERLLKKWKHVYVTNKVLTDLVEGLKRQLERKNIAIDLPTDKGDE